MPWDAWTSRCLCHGLASATIALHAWAAGMSWGLYFAFYNRAKDRYQRWTGQSKLAPQVHLLSAAEAGCVVSVSGMVRFCLSWGPNGLAGSFAEGRDRRPGEVLLLTMPQDS